MSASIAFQEVVKNPDLPSGSQVINNTLQQFIFQSVKKDKEKRAEVDVVQGCKCL
jgi:hypothetical protein